MYTNFGIIKSRIALKRMSCSSVSGASRFIVPAAREIGMMKERSV